VAWALKPLPVAILALGVARVGRGSGAGLLAAALAVDAVADGVIEASFLGGLALFLVGHVLRIAGFTVEEPRPRWARGLPFLAVAVSASVVLAPTSGALGGPIVAYAVAICAMGWRAAARVDGTPLRWLGLAGAVTFAVSDTLLAANRFFTPLPLSDLLILGTYWGAQALIAASVRGRLGIEMKQPGAGAGSAAIGEARSAPCSPCSWLVSDPPTGRTR
jgi:uncharacterized membrane protein YhhN